jgi:hexosaminidase
MPTVFPAPRAVERLSGAGSLELTDIEVDPHLPVNGYELEVGESGTRVRHADELGLRYARQTLTGLEPVACRIVDHPDFAHRGFMLDISRDRVPTNETLAWLVEVLATLRYNHLELYIEHTFAFAGHEAVWTDASPITAAELGALDRLCAAQGMELSVCQNTFGHMGRFLAHDAYRPRAECPDGARSPFDGRPMAPSTLAPTEANAALGLELVRAQLAHVASRRVNIGADEPFELGQGASAAAVADRGRAAVYLEHLRRLTDPLIADGLEVLFWGDVLRRHPELVGLLPPGGATAIVWNYEAPEATPGGFASLLPERLLELLGMPSDSHLGFVAHTRSYADVGYPFWVAPGTSSWNSLIGRWSNARANLLDAAEVGRAQSAPGFLLTDWGDNGHLQPLAISLPAIVYGAGVAWCADTNADMAPEPAIDHITGLPGFGAILTSLGDVYLDSGLMPLNGSPLFAALVPSSGYPILGQPDPAGHREGLAKLAAALEALPAGRLGDEVHAAVRLARQGAWRLGRGAGLEGPDDDALGADLAGAIDCQRSAWLASSRPGGLADSLARLPGV